MRQLKIYGHCVKNTIWHLFLAIAFLSMQSASAHIHLSSSHEHDGHDHSYPQIIHAHNVVSHHIDAFKSDNQTHSSEVVVLCQDWITKYGKYLSDLETQAALVSNFSFDERNPSTKIYFDNPVDHLGFHFLFKVQARAPPTLFSLHV